jgi:surface protein
MKPKTKNALEDLIKTVKDLNSIDTSLITDMESMFSSARSFNQPLNNWDVSNVRNMRWVFCNAASFNQPLNN